MFTFLQASHPVGMNHQHIQLPMASFPALLAQDPVRNRARRLVARSYKTTISREQHIKFSAILTHDDVQFRKHTSAHPNTSTACVGAHTGTHICICICMYVPMHLCKCVHVIFYIYIYIYIDRYIDIFIYLYICVYVYRCV